MKRQLREQIEHLEREGFRVQVRRHGRANHVLLSVECNGRQGIVTVGTSPSDKRARSNMLSCARRVCGLV